MQKTDRGETYSCESVQGLRLASIRSACGYFDSHISCFVAPASEQIPTVNRLFNVAFFF